MLEEKPCFKGFSGAELVALKILAHSSSYNKGPAMCLSLQGWRRFKLRIKVRISLKV